MKPLEHMNPVFGEICRKFVQDGFSIRAAGGTIKTMPLNVDAHYTDGAKDIPRRIEGMNRCEC